MSSSDSVKATFFLLKQKPKHKICHFVKKKENTNRKNILHPYTAKREMDTSIQERLVLPSSYCIPSFLKSSPSGKAVRMTQKNGHLNKGSQTMKWKIFKSK